MKNIKRLIALICTLSLGSAVFSGCAKVEKTDASKATTNEKVLNVAVFQGGYGREVWDELGKKFEEENKGVTVKITANPKLGDVIRPQIMSGNPPDFIFLSGADESGILQSLIQDKALANLDDVFTDEFKSKFIDGALNTPTTAPYGDEKIYAAPLSSSMSGLFYNKKLFADNNWKVPETWDEFFALGDKAKAKGIALFTYAAANAPSYNEIVVNPAIASAGGEQALNDCFNYKPSAWSSDAVKKVLGIYKRMADGGYLLNGTLAMNHTQSQEQFLQNKALFIPNGNWLENEMQKTPRADGFEYGFTGIPTFNKGDKKYVYSSFEEMYIPSKAKNVDLAKKFMKFLYSDESIKIFADKAGFIPPIKGAADLAKDSFSKAVYDTYTITDKGYIPASGSFAMTKQTEVDLRNDLYNDLNSVMAGKMDVAKWSQHLEKDSAELSKILLK